MRKILSCEFNLDTACVELCPDDGTLLSVDCTAVKNEVANNMQQWSELDWLIYTELLEFADWVLNGEIEVYLNAVIEYKILDQDASEKMSYLNITKVFWKKIDNLQDVWYYIFRQEKSSQIQRQLF
jgi:hypothetical protein